MNPSDTCPECDSRDHYAGGGIAHKVYCNIGLGPDAVLPRETFRAYCERMSLKKDKREGVRYTFDHRRAQCSNSLVLINAKYVILAQDTPATEEPKIVFYTESRDEIIEALGALVNTGKLT